MKVIDFLAVYTDGLADNGTEYSGFMSYILSCHHKDVPSFYLHILNLPFNLETSLRELSIERLVSDIRSANSYEQL